MDYLNDSLKGNRKLTNPMPDFQRTGLGVEKLYESENFLVVNKPYDMYINSDDEKEKNTVTYQIASGDSHLSSSANPLHFVQRLDYATSGVLCIAKTKYAAARAGELFEKRETGKYYLAVVRGRVEGVDVGEIKFPVGVDPVTARTCHKMIALKNMESLATCTQPRAAHTRMLLLEHGYYAGEPVSVLLLKPITGRRHQLRVHCAAIGHTILGDYTYSCAADHKPHRMFLHAMRLVLPLKNEHLDIQTADPFFCDDKFTSMWRSEKTFHRYKTRDEFRKACDTLNEYFILGFKYKHFIFVENDSADKKNNNQEKDSSSEQSVNPSAGEGKGGASLSQHSSKGDAETSDQVNVRKNLKKADPASPKGKKKDKMGQAVKKNQQKSKDSPSPAVATELKLKQPTTSPRTSLETSNPGDSTPCNIEPFLSVTPSTIKSEDVRSLLEKIEKSTSRFSQFDSHNV